MVIKVHYSDNQSYQNAYVEGYEAYRQGLEIKNCPYDPDLETSEEQFAWIRGYRAAKDLFGS